MKNKNILSLTRVLFALGILTAPMASVEAAWSTPTVISANLSDQPDVAIDGNGNAMLVWQGFDETNYNIQVSQLPVGGSWTTPVVLSVSGQDSQNPTVGLDLAGNAVVTWSRYNGTNSIVQGATLPVSGIWSNPVNISNPGRNADSSYVVMHPWSSVSLAVAVWHRYNGANFVMQSSSLQFGGTWTLPINISASGQDALVPVVAIDLSGNAAAVCSRFDGTNFTSRAATYLSGSTWGSSTVLSTPGSTAAQQSIAMDGMGNSVIAWSLIDNDSSAVQMSSFHFGDGWTTPATISNPGFDAFIPEVVVDLAGNTTILWIGYTGDSYVAQAANCPVSTGVWSTPVNLSVDGGNVSTISVAVDAGGNVVAVWDRTDGITSKVQSSTLPFNGSWTTAVDLTDGSQIAYLPSVDVSSTGDAVAAWLQNDGTTTLVYSSSLPFGG